LKALDKLKINNKKMVTLEDYKIDKDQADYLLTIKCRTYEDSELTPQPQHRFKDVELVMYVIKDVYSIEDEEWYKLVGEYVKENVPNFTSYSIKLKEIKKVEEREELTFIVSIPEQDKANEWIEEQREINKHKGVTSGERFGYQFIPTGLGVCVAVVDLLTGKSKDVTDPLNW
tara:strand:- start:715 stop:1233 length:519 start_codon:yes stop_codon:yes gene_type:complete